MIHFYHSIRAASFALLFVVASPLAWSQEDSPVKPPPYRGVSEHVEGIFVTPVPGVPLSAVIEVKSTKVLADGTNDVKKTSENIARDSQGRIYNERRELVSPSFSGKPQLLSFHIFDPTSRLNTFLDPNTHLARQSTFPQRPSVPEAIPDSKVVARNPLLQEQDLGTEIMENVVVRGTRKSRTVPARASGTGKEIVVTDEYWYSDELHLNMLVKHDDPRTGQQTVTVTRVDRGEPDQAMFEIPAGYRVVDETPER
jgi:hypothetical protein